MEFRQAVQDVISNNSGPKLRRAMTRLMKHPQYRDAHASDDHFMSAMFVAGAAGDVEDEGCHGKLMAEDWELVSQVYVEEIPANVFVDKYVQLSVYLWGMDHCVKTILNLGLAPKLKLADLSRCTYTFRILFYY